MISSSVLFVVGAPLVLAVILSIQGDLNFDSFRFWAIVMISSLVVFKVGKGLYERIRRQLRKSRNRVVRNLNSPFLSQDHFLDLRMDFLKKHENKVISLGTYLGSLEYDREDDDLGYLMISAIASHLGLSQLAIPFLFPPKLVPTDKTVTTTASLLSRFTLEEFPSILVLAGLIDGAAQFVLGRNDPAFTQTYMFDTPDVFFWGENPGVLPAMPSAFSHTNCIEWNETLRVLVNSTEMDLGPDPDKFHFFCPRPIANNLLPGLCTGPGGLKMNVTPRELAQNRVFALLCNKLAANLMGRCGYGPSDSQSGQVYSEFSVVIAGKRVYSPKELMQVLLDEGGGELTSRIRSNLTSFGFELCLLDSEDNMEFGRTTLDQRHRYTCIPLAFRTRTGVMSLSSSNISNIHQLSTHSAVEWSLTNNSLIGGDLKFTFYTGIEGFTGFKPGGEWERCWVLESQNLQPLSHQDALRALTICSCISVSANLCVREGRFPFGGYGGLGICCDSVAWVESILHGKTTLFPLVMRGDAKTWLMRVLYLHVLRKLQSDPTPPEYVQDFIQETMIAAKHLVLLPNDIQVEPHEVEDSLIRIAKSIFPQSPFVSDQLEHDRLQKIGSEWKRILQELGLRGLHLTHQPEPED